MPILGLLSTESDTNWRFKNVRRQVFYHYPNGAAPLTGLLSLLPEEVTDDPEFSWWEKRMPQQRSQTPGSGQVMEDANGNALSNTALSAGTSYRIKLTGTPAGEHLKFRVGHVIRAVFDTTTSGVTDVVRGVITDIFPATPSLRFRCLANTATLNLAAGQNINKEVLVVGSAFSQGAVDGTTMSTTASNTTAQPYTTPTELSNYCQIFRSPFLITGTAMKTGVKYDDQGVYKDQAKEASVMHMIEMEKAFIFGTRLKDTSGTLPTFFTGGILWFLQQWEGGTVYGNTAATQDFHDNKRIIANSSGLLDEKTYDGYLERVFRVTNNKSSEKLVLCGSGFLNVINRLYKSKSTLDASLPLTETYGMNVVRHLTPFGTLYYKTHPLFSQNDSLRYNALFLDLGNLRYRYVEGRDTTLLKNRQPNDADFRKDEWLTECGLELRFPESFMYLQNVQDYAP